MHFVQHYPLQSGILRSHKLLNKQANKAAFQLRRTPSPLLYSKEKSDFKHTALSCIGIKLEWFDSNHSLSVLSAGLGINQLQDSSSEMKRMIAMWSWDKGTVTHSQQLLCLYLPIKCEIKVPFNGWLELLNGLALQNTCHSLALSTWILHLCMTQSSSAVWAWRENVGTAIWHEHSLSQEKNQTANGIHLLICRNNEVKQQNLANHIKKHLHKYFCRQQRCLWTKKRGVEVTMAPGQILTGFPSLLDFSFIKNCWLTLQSLHHVGF